MKPASNIIFEITKATKSKLCNFIRTNVGEAGAPLLISNTLKDVMRKSCVYETANSFTCTGDQKYSNITSILKGHHR